MTSEANVSDPLSGKVAVITGAAGVIGHATAILFARRGVRIVVVEHPSVDVSALRAALPDTAIFVAADVTKEEDARGYAEQALDRAGRIDILFNNAGVEGPFAPIGSYPTADFQRVLDVNVNGVFLGLRVILPLMIAQRSGAIVNTSSIAGLVGGANMSAYYASKHAVLGLTRAAALEGAAAGVRVNALHPGFVDSRMFSEIMQRAGRSPADVAVNIPSGRLASADEIAKGVAFLASDDSSYMTGASLVLDGGLMAR